MQLTIADIQIDVKEFECSATWGGVISDAPYENCRPSFTDTIKFTAPKDGDMVSVLGNVRDILTVGLKEKFDVMRNNLKAEAVAMEYDSIRFRELGGLQYPSVTSITGWAKDFHITDIELEQYGCRGTIVHFLVEHFCRTGEWLTLRDAAANGYEEEATIMHKGGLGLTLDDLSYKKFFEGNRKDFEFDEFEKTIFNREHLYCGRLDAIGRYKGVKSIIDFKTGSSWEMAQLAAYAMGDGIDGIEQLVICPVGKTDNKCGYMKPVIELNVQGAFDNFLKLRSKFKKRFGV